mmetsp:Transcript_35693/g.65479  ORF Transcript_35693/g.65479 Transcript_35693/m.65479 type:complete len:311 (+) Transcript_35693:98-1030(+)
MTDLSDVKKNTARRHGFIPVQIFWKDSKLKEHALRLIVQQDMKLVGEASFLLIVKSKAKDLDRDLNLPAKLQMFIGEECVLDEADVEKKSPDLTVKQLDQERNKEGSSSWQYILTMSFAPGAANRPTTPERGSAPETPEGATISSRPPRSMSTESEQQQVAEAMNKYPDRVPVYCLESGVTPPQVRKLLPNSSMTLDELKWVCCHHFRPGELPTAVSGVMLYVLTSKQFYGEAGDEGGQPMLLTEPSTLGELYKQHKSKSDVGVVHLSVKIGADVHFEPVQQDATKKHKQHQRDKQSIVSHQYSEMPASQ